MFSECCESLIGAIDGYLAKVDSRLYHELDLAGFCEPGYTVKSIGERG